MNGDAGRVVVLGDCMLDRLFTVSLAGFNPEEPNTFIYEYIGEKDFPGGAANVAANVVSLGARATLFGIVGADDNGGKLERLLYSNGISAQLYRNRDTVTTLKTRFRTYTSYQLRVDHDGHTPASFPFTNMANHFHELLCTGRYATAIFSDYGKGVFANPAYWRPSLDWLNRNDVLYLVDPSKVGDWTAFGGPLALFKVNLQQAMRFISATALHDDLQRIAPFSGRATPLDRYLQLAELLRSAFLLSGIRSQFLWLTLGEVGSLVGQTDVAHSWQHLPAYVMTDKNNPGVLDVCGAGDTCIAALAVHIATTVNSNRFQLIKDGCDHAARAAAVAVSRCGTATVTREDLAAVKYQAELQENLWQTK